MHPSPIGCWGESWEVLTAIIGQWASTLQCLDRPIENALGAVKLVKIGGKIGEGIIGFWLPTNSILVLWPKLLCKVSSNSIQNCVSMSDDRHTHTHTHTYTHTDTQTPAILLSAPCYAIAMGQIIITLKVGKGPKNHRNGKRRKQNLTECCSACKGFA